MKTETKRNQFWILMLILSTLSISFGDVVARSPEWNDSVRVVLIWNSGAEEPVATNTKEFVLDAIGPIENVAVYTGSSPVWPTATLDTFRDNFAGQLPHVIVYINSGWLWDDLNKEKTQTPYSILQEASDSGIGIVAIGDDAAFDGQFIFPMTGPDGTGKVINKDSLMYDATDFDSVWISLDSRQNTYLPDGGLLWNVDADTLFFKTIEEGRVQADADRWDIDSTWLHNYSYVGHQQAWSDTLMTFELENGDSVNSRIVHPDPYHYKSLTALQRLNQRIAMLSYQPQFIRDSQSSSQIVYNSVYWSSKAHEQLQLPTPIANPAGGELSSSQTIELTVNIHNSTLYEIHYTTDGSEPTRASSMYVAPITLETTGTAFTLKVIAFATDSVEWKDSETMVEVYSVNRQIVTLSANPESCSFFGDTTVTLTSNVDNAIIYVTIDGSEPDTNNSGQRYSSPITVDQTTTITAIAVAPDYTNSGIHTWKYTKEEPTIELTANPESCSFFGDTTVTISSNVDNAVIYVTTDGSEPDTNNSGQRYSSPITVDQTITITAIAVAPDYTNSGIYLWHYTKYEPTIVLTANPESCSFYGDTAVTLSCNAGNAVIYFTTDGSEPDTTNSGQRYNSPISVDQTTTISAIAIAPDYTNSGVVQWHYSKSLYQTTLKVTPENNSGYGEEITISLETNADSIFYTIDGTVPGRTDSYTGAFTVSEDSVLVIATATGNDFTTVTDTFNFYRQRVPDVTITPEKNGFSPTVEVTLGNTLEKAEIYYTTNGSTPDTLSASTFRYTGETLRFSEDVIITAQAFATDYVPSSIVVKEFYREAQVVHAVYNDMDRNGFIDRAVLEFDTILAELPTTVLLKSPFDSMQMVQVQSDQIQWGDDRQCIVSLEETFESSSFSTTFEPARLGTIESGRYSNVPFEISDSVAPVVVRGEYLFDIGGNDSSYADSLLVTFSEPITENSATTPLVFYSGTVQCDPIQLTPVKYTGNTILYTFNSNERDLFLGMIDSLSINPESALADRLGTIQDRENRKAPCFVDPQPVSLSWSVLWETKENPLFYDVIINDRAVTDKISITEGTILVLDPGVILVNVPIQEITGTITLFDPVGNVVVRSDNYINSEDPFLQGAVVQNGSRVQIAILWNGKNRNNRRVGTGVYSGVISLNIPNYGEFETKVYVPYAW